MMDAVSDKKKYKSIPIMKAVLTNDKKLLADVLTHDKSLCDFVYKKSGDTPLILAARYGFLDILNLLISCGADIEHKNLDGKRALHEAALSGSLSCVQMLVSSLANVDVLKRADWTPLMFACSNNHLEVASYLIDQGADIKIVNKDGWTCFHLACREGHMEILNLLYSHDKSSAQTVSNNGRTALHTACMSGSLNVAQFLISNCNVELCKQDSCGNTPFMDSIRFGHVEIARKLLIENVECLKDKDFLERNCLHVASQSGDLKAIKFLVEECSMNVKEPCTLSKQTCLHFAAKEGHVNALEYIVTLVDNLNIGDKFDRTPLHLAVGANKIEAVRLLLRNGCDHSIIDKQNKMPFDYALSVEMKTLHDSLT